MSNAFPKIIAHRGASHDAPENTRAAIALAWQAGADAVEIDVRLTRDRRIVAIHDADTGRVANENLSVADTDFDLLARLDVGTHKGPEWAAETIPPLDEVVANLPPEGRLWIEVKCGPEILDTLVPLLAATPDSATRLAVASYDDRVLAGAKRAVPHVPAFLVARFEPVDDTDHAPPGSRWSPTTEQLLTTARSAGLDGLLLREVGPLDAAMAAEIADAGFGLCVWTVDSPARARQLIALGVQGILTNRPAWLRQQLLAAAEI